MSSDLDHMIDEFFPQALFRPGRMYEDRNVGRYVFEACGGPFNKSLIEIYHPPLSVGDIICIFGCGRNGLNVGYMSEAITPTVINSIVGPVWAGFFHRGTSLGQIKGRHSRKISHMDISALLGVTHCVTTFAPDDDEAHDEMMQNISDSLKDGVLRDAELVISDWQNMDGYSVTEGDLDACRISEDKLIKATHFLAENWNVLSFATACVFGRGSS